MQAAYLKHEFAIRSHRPDWSYDLAQAARAGCTLRRPTLYLDLVRVRDDAGRFLSKTQVRKMRRAPRLTTKAAQVDRSAAARKAWETIRAKRLSLQNETNKQTKSNQ